MTKVEEVARALADIDLDGACPDYERNLQIAARAAIKAMIEAGKIRNVEVWDGDIKRTVPGLGECGLTSYQRMIDAALAEDVR